MLASCANDPEDGASDATDPSAAAEGLSGTYTVDEKEIPLECAGEGPLTMVLEVGEGAPREALSGIGKAYQSRMRVCSYDRAGTGKDVVSELHGLLAAAQVPGPYVLVGHSAGGLIAEAYGATYPDETAGVVALNPVPPWRPWSSRGLKEMTPAERRDEAAYYAGTNAESLDYRAISELVTESPAPQTVPLHVLISTVAQCDSPTDVCGRTYPAYEQIEKDLARHWGAGRFSQVEAPHEIPTEDVRPAIDDVIARIRQ